MRLRQSKLEPLIGELNPENVGKLRKKIKLQSENVLTNDWREFVAILL